ncbi:MAG: metalloregulator ArsR/SmtB family transcription factor [Planctomycetota bacterium]|nr:metalloregulator ArsR/SmtB family transcription factor [Planctomycetota bacterium]
MNKCGCDDTPDTSFQAPTAAVDTAGADADLARFAKALGHPARVAILRHLAERSGCCGEIVDFLDLPQSTVSQHLKVLKDAGLVQGEVDGTRVCYCAGRVGLRRLRCLIAEIG